MSRRRSSPPSQRPPRYQSEATLLARKVELADWHLACTGDPALGPIDVAAIRIRMHMTQKGFARRFGFPLTTLRHWEREDRRPSGASLVLLHVIREQPRVVLDVLARIRHKRNPIVLA